MKNKPFLLCILDGVGLTEQRQGNALKAANALFIKHLLEDRPCSSLKTSGKDVGLPDGQMGNSEVGHTTIGSGRVIKQALEQITEDLDTSAFSRLESYQSFLKGAQAMRAIHLIGLVSDGGVHSHGDHAHRLCELFNQIGRPVFVHAITDGRDTDPYAGKKYLQGFQQAITDLENVSLASVIGRFYAMDRDKRWERTQQAWSLYTDARGASFKNLVDLFENAYENGKSDEYILPSLLESTDSTDSRILQGDAVFLFNFRADRMRQITELLLGNPVEDLEYNNVTLSALATMTSYDSRFDRELEVIYVDEDLKGTIGEEVAKAGIAQLRIAETEKYPHVTFYLNGGREAPYDKEDRILVKSPTDVTSYDEKPEMSLPEVTEKLVTAISSGQYGFIALNIANGDMVGHSGNFDAAVKAVEAIDHALKKITDALKMMQGQALIIADHGNVEEMLKNDKPSTTHSMNPVPCIYFGDQPLKLRSGSLADVAPTVLQLMGLPTPRQMTGRSLVESASLI